MANKFSFSGHETFHCRHFWLKKGYDFIKNGNRFADPEAVVILGVGKNMVSAIRFWMRAFGLIDSNSQLTKLAHYIFGENGKDPFLENVGTLWLLHYYLIKTNYSSIYSLVFNEFRKERIEFTKRHLEIFLQKKCDELGINVSSKILNRDINVFIKNYIKPNSKSKSIEEDFSAIFIDLNLVQELNFAEIGIYDWYTIQNLERDEIPIEIILFSILDKHSNERSISFNKLLKEVNNVGSVFALNASGLIKKIEDIIKVYDGITFSDDAGIKELQIKHELNKWEILDNYYAYEILAID